jgi:hypothetical protein
MGWFVFLIKNVLEWLDRQSERPLLKAVPDLDMVLLDPQRALAGREVVIGPANRYATALVLGIFFACAGWLVAVVVFVLAFEPAPARPGQPVDAGCFFAVLAIVLQVASILFMLQWLRGGQLVLSERGVELRYRGTVVFCPWTLFNTPGQPFPPDRARVVLPVAAVAVPQVEARRRDRLLAQGLRVRTRQLRFRSAGEAVLAAFYEVSTLDLGKVLLHLGRILGTALPVPAASLDFPLGEVVEEDPAQMSRNGWVTVSLTRLAFPPVCCDCGTATLGRQKFRVTEPFLGLSRLRHPIRSEAIHVWVPVCYACQTANNRRLRKAVWNGLSVGVLAIFLSALGVCLWPASGLARVLFVLSVLLGPVLGALLGYHLHRDRAMPVQMKHYLPGKGTVALRFRRPEYTEQLLQSLKVRAEPVQPRAV